MYKYNGGVWKEMRDSAESMSICHPKAVRRLRSEAKMSFSSHLSVPYGRIHFLIMDARSLC